MEEIIGIGFVVIWVWCIYEAMKAPVMPEDYEDDVPWEEDPEVLDFWLLWKSKIEPQNHPRKRVLNYFCWPLKHDDFPETFF